MIRYKNKKAQTILDYTILVVLVLTSFMLFRGYIQRGIFGRWKAAGDAIGHGKLYEP